jgi:hypothetical protein
MQFSKSLISKTIAATAALAATSAMAQTAPTVDVSAVVGSLVTAITQGVSQTFTQIGPLLALVFGVAFAWKWIKKGASN